MSTRQDHGDRDRGSPTGPSAGGQPRSDRNPWNWLLLLPLLATLVPPLYNRLQPELLGIPFFYWYQFVAIALGVGCTLVVYVKTKG